VSRRVGAREVSPERFGVVLFQMLPESWPTPRAPSDHRAPQRRSEVAKGDHTARHRRCGLLVRRAAVVHMLHRATVRRGHRGSQTLVVRRVAVRRVLGGWCWSSGTGRDLGTERVTGGVVAGWRVAGRWVAAVWAVLVGGACWLVATSGAVAGPGRLVTGRWGDRTPGPETGAVVGVWGVVAG